MTPILEFAIKCFADNFKFVKEDYVCVFGK